MQLQVIWHMLYTEDSAADQFTLYKLQNLINRREAELRKEPTHYLLLITTCFPYPHVHTGVF